MPLISATVITKNEAANIGRAIRSLSCADEVLVVDCGSSDGTCEIAASLGARVLTHPWEGFAAQKNFASQQARHDWILSLDADEELDSEAQGAVVQWKNSDPAAPGYRFARRARYLGRWILHSGWYPDYKVRLFDRRQGLWVGPFLHESVMVSGRLETLAGEILHYTCETIEEHRQRIEFYTDLAAQEMYQRGQRGSLIPRLLGAPWVFVDTYFRRLGVLDGVPGLWIAWMAARYVNRKYAKLAGLYARSRLVP